MKWRVERRQGINCKVKKGSRGIKGPATGLNATSLGMDRSLNICISSGL